MILEIGDGRELRLPDDMPDETARQLKRLILALEERAQVAESEVRTLRDEMASLRSAVTAAPDTSVVDALNQMREEIGAKLRQVAAVAGADRILVHGADGTPRSRIAR